MERLLQCTRKTLILRESLSTAGEYKYVIDKYLDDDIQLKVHVNTYLIYEVKDFIQSYGFSVQVVLDIRTGGEPEMVIDYPHYWKFLVARKNR